MKKVSQKGFTLIELLAVITIMGILMMIAIPAVSRTIENSRRDTFADIAHEYINAVRNNVLADNIKCGDVVASATTNGTYYFTIDTTAQGTKDLMESGGKSPFGNAEMQGYVKWVKTVNATTGKTTYTYTMVLSDTGKHGFNTEKSESDINRAAVDPALSSAAAKEVSGATLCELS